MRTTSARCMSRSINDTTQAALGKTSPQSANARFVVTTNRAFADWGEVFPNAACVVSLIDRLMHRAEVVRIDGQSYRAKEAQEREAQRLAARSAKATPARSRKAAA